MKKLTTEEFILKSKAVHSNKYSYTKTEYTKSKASVIITCPIHGDFEQSANSHIQGYGCNKCAIAQRALSETQSRDTYISKANAKHDNFYDYTKLVYTNVHTKGVIICPIHGEFTQKLNSHLAGVGCPECGKRKAGSSRSFFKNKPTLLYVLLLQNGAYKVGVTSKGSITKRYYSDTVEPFSIHFQVTVLDGADAYSIEQDVIKTFSTYNYVGDKLFKRTKNHEVFTKDPTAYIVTLLNKLTNLSTELKHDQTSNRNT